MSQPFRLDGRRALITGGASGIGEQTSRTLAQAGAQVFIADLNNQAADKLAAEVGSGALSIGLDVSDPASVAAAFSKIDHLDYLINNAGVGSVGTIEECTHEEWSRVMRVNIIGFGARRRGEYWLGGRSGRGEAAFRLLRFEGSRGGHDAPTGGGLLRTPTSQLHLPRYGRYPFC